MKYYLITGKTPEIAGREEQPYIPERCVQEPGGHFRIIPERLHSPAIAPVPSQEIRIEIGESNPFDTSGKPFQVKYHESLGIVNLDNWKRLIQLYGTRITHEFIVTPEGLRQMLPGSMVPGAVVPAFHLISLLNDGFSKAGEGDKIIYSKQKGRIEDDNQNMYTPEEMIKILEDK